MVKSDQSLGFSSLRAAARKNFFEIAEVLINLIFRGALAAIVLALKWLLTVLISASMGNLSDDPAIHQVLSNISAVFFIGVSLLITIEGVVLLGIHLTKGMIDDVKTKLKPVVRPVSSEQVQEGDD